MMSLLLDDILVQLRSLTINAQCSSSRQFAILYLPIGDLDKNITSLMANFVNSAVTVLIEV